MKCPRCLNDNPEGTRFCGRCGRELPGPGETVASGTATFQTPTKGLERGTMFARRFEIIEEIGKGGMGTVYKAYDNKIREVVALKLLKPEIASDLEVIERFRNEIKLARQVSHRHVCRMYDLGEEWLSIYISMEYVAGEDLKSFIRRSGHLNEAKAVGLAKQIAEGLAEAHRIGVVHRDLKPQNVMIDKDGNAKIMDFGIARSLHTKGVTGTGVIIGTPEYMAPEQAEGRDIDHRVDIYALGAILFEMVTGRVPFEGATPLSIVLKHRSEPPADPQTINVQLSPGLSRIILKCLEKSRDKRFQLRGRGARGPDGRGTGPARDRPGHDAGQAHHGPRDHGQVQPQEDPGPGAHRGRPGHRRGRFARQPRRKGPAGGRSRPDRILQDGRGAERDLHVTATVPPAPERAGEEGTATPPGLESGVGSAIMGYLAPFVKDPAKFMKEEDAIEFNKTLAVIKEKYPAEASKLNQWIDSIQTRIAEGKKQKEAGNLEASKRSYDRGESEMRKLLSQVSEREKAEAAFKELRETKQKMSRGAQARPNLLAWIALEKEKDASDAFAKNDFSGARILCGILTRVHLLSPRAADEDQGLALLRELAGTGRKDAEAALAPSKQAWLFERAVTEEEGARQMAKDGLVPQAAEQYILAAFLYEKAKEVSLESAQAGRN